MLCWPRTMGARILATKEVAMRISVLLRTLLPVVLFSLSATAQNKACPKDDSGLKLPPGFCATVFADGIGHARHLVVAPNGVVYVNTWSGDDYPPGETPPAGGFLVALQDKAGTGKADARERFGESVQSGGAGGTGIALYNGSIYAEINDRIVRYALTPGSIVPTGPALTDKVGRQSRQSRTDKVGQTKMTLMRARLF